ncbi:hypothetical protein OUZ56_030794 [Daphnia magna]|uniref:Uncharacterized protein n=1 Tax=Daphnia magna TaxID=35525 RepID=A0ABQ9ZSW1_9CRUS|nr:hypothetical protein OUZ56_030794 [Daphnia magna]
MADTRTAEMQMIELEEKQKWGEQICRRGYFFYYDEDCLIYKRVADTILTCLRKRRRLVCLHHPLTRRQVDSGGN